MPDVLVRDVSEETLSRLKKQAEAHRRSLQQELLAILEQAVTLSPAETLRHARPVRKQLAESGRRFRDSVPLIRAEREK